MEKQEPSSIPIEVIKQWLKNNDDWRARAAAINIYKNRDIPIEIIKQGLNDPIWHVRKDAIDICKDRRIPLQIIKQGLSDENKFVRRAAMEICKNRDVPIGILKQGLNDRDIETREIAINICKSKNIPTEIFKEMLRSQNPEVRVHGMAICYQMGIPIPASRAFEPPELVYKKCCQDVIVIAEIPKDAHVRGQAGDKCRASKAIIKDIIGDFYGSSIGISMYNHTVIYYPGQEVSIPDFDFTDKKCSTGFHFFCTFEETKNYKG